MNDEEATTPNLDSKLAGLCAVAHTHCSLISSHGAFGTLPGVQTTVRGASTKADPTVHLIGLSNFNGQTAPTPTPGLHWHTAIMMIPARAVTAVPLAVVRVRRLGVLGCHWQHTIACAEAPGASRTNAAYTPFDSSSPCKMPVGRVRIGPSRHGCQC